MQPHGAPSGSRPCLGGSILRAADAPEKQEEYPHEFAPGVREPGGRTRGEQGAATALTRRRGTSHARLEIGTESLKHVRDQTLAAALQQMPDKLQQPVPECRADRRARDPGG